MLNPLPFLTISAFTYIWLPAVTHRGTRRLSAAKPTSPRGTCHRTWRKALFSGPGRRTPSSPSHHRRRRRRHCAARAETGAQLGSSVAFGSGCGQVLPGVPRKSVYMMIFESPGTYGRNRRVLRCRDSLAQGIVGRVSESSALGCRLIWALRTGISAAARLRNNPPVSYSANNPPPRGLARAAQI